MTVYGSFGLKDDYPALWEIAVQQDFAERLGGCTDPLHNEVTQALQELWMARASQVADEA